MLNLGLESFVIQAYKADQYFDIQSANTILVQSLEEDFRGLDFHILAYKLLQIMYPNKLIIILLVSILQVLIKNIFSKLNIYIKIKLN